MPLRPFAGRAVFEQHVCADWRLLPLSAQEKRSCLRTYQAATAGKFAHGCQGLEKIHHRDSRSDAEDDCMAGASTLLPKYGIL